MPGTPCVPGTRGRGAGPDLPRGVCRRQSRATGRPRGGNVSPTASLRVGTTGIGCEIRAQRQAGDRWAGVCRRQGQAGGRLPVGETVLPHRPAGRRRPYPPPAWPLTICRAISASLACSAHVAGSSERRRTACSAPPRGLLGASRAREPLGPPAGSARRWRP